jgi:NADH-quinone oxidoreductase subunit H
VSGIIDYLTSPAFIAYASIVGVVFGGLQIMAAVMVYAERKVAAFMQQRYGPYLVGPEGPAPAGRRHPQVVLQGRAAAEGGGCVPVHAGADHFGRGRLPRLCAGAVRRADRRSSACSTSRWRCRCRTSTSRCSVIFAVASMGVYGIVLAGWASNSKYSLLGGLRSSAQMISYELAYGVSLATVVMMADTMSLKRSSASSRATGSVSFRAGTSFRSSSASSCSRARALPKPTARLSIFPEAEQELVAGYHTEYSSMRFAMFFMAEYINMVTVSAVAVNLFLGGWHGTVDSTRIRLDLVRDQARLPVVLLPVAALDAAALPLRPADVVRLESAAALATVNLLLTAAGISISMFSDALLFYAFAGAAVLGALLGRCRRKTPSTACWR